MIRRTFYPFKSIHTGIAIAFSCLILITTSIVSLNSYRLSSDAVTESSAEYTTELINQVKRNIQTYIGNMESISTLALNNEDIRRLMSLSEPHSAEGIALRERINVFFDSIVESRNDIASILFLGSNGAVASDRPLIKLKPNHDLVAQEWYTTALKAGGAVTISPSHVQHVYRNEYRWVVSISRQLPVTEKGDYGVLLVDLNYNVIDDLLKRIKLGNKGYVFIVDPSGDLIYHPQQQLIYTKLKSEDISALLSAKDGSMDSEKNGVRIAYTVSTTSFGWKIVGVTYPDDHVGNKRKMQLTTALWGLLFLLVALAISVFLAYTLTKPVKRLEAHMKQAERGDFDIRVHIDSPNEIGKLARTFNLMIGKIKELMEQIVKEQEMKRISELKALQAQIHPHFLYNTLDSIIWMAEIGKVDEVVKMTSALSKLLRSSISKGEELVPISVELEHIDNYLTIQHMRYKNKFTYSIEVDPDILPHKILKIVLQPLVENAIYHGMKEKAETGHIRVTGRRTGEAMELAVEDDGVGMSGEKAKSLLKSVGEAGQGKGVGLMNVNHRIKLYFGEPYGLEITSEPDEGTRAVLRIPVVR